MKKIKILSSKNPTETFTNSNYINLRIFRQKKKMNVNSNQR